MGFVSYHAQLRPMAFYAHVGLAPVALFLLPFQFLSGLRARRPALHRWIGRTYALTVLLSGLGGLALALSTEAGLAAASGFAMLAVLWLVTTGAGVWTARAGDITAHRRWMIRSAALTFAAVTLRLELPLMIMGGLAFPTAYSIVGWLCWVPNLLLAEWLLRAKPQHTRALSAEFVPAAGR